MLKDVVAQHDEESKQVTLKLLDRLFSKAVGDVIGVRLWDGTQWPDDHSRPVWLVLHHAGALRNMLGPGTELGLAEAYLYDDFDIEGDIFQVFQLADILAKDPLGLRDKLASLRDLRKLPFHEHDMHTTERGPAHLSGKQHSIERDRQAVTYHYNVSNTFYQLWLDQRMVYSCAYFRSPADDLDTAQFNKLDLICRKLRLKPGQRVLDIGCGWGGLVIHAARYYGVDVTGITLSEPQAKLANQRIAETGLADRARVRLCDYREMDESQPFDTLVSVGMFEHVGRAMLPVYFKKAHALLKPRGVFLNHGIALRATDPIVPPGTTFNDVYVFPDGELVPVYATLEAAEETGFEVRDVESLREHYALTLRHWVQRLDSHREAAREEVDEVTYRVWRLFMAGSSDGFKSGRLNLYQSLLVKPDGAGNSGLPMTRENWYASSASVKE